LLAHIDFLEESLAQLQADIDAHLAPYAQAMELLQTIPGIAATAAGAIIAEIGVDMGRFVIAKHLASWAGVCPDNKQSGGKRLNGAVTHGSPWLRAALGEVAQAIGRSKGAYLSAQFQRIARRRGKHKAVLAVAHTPS